MRRSDCCDNCANEYDCPKAYDRCRKDRDPLACERCKPCYDFEIKGLVGFREFRTAQEIMKERAR